MVKTTFMSGNGLFTGFPLHKDQKLLAMRAFRCPPHPLMRPLASRTKRRLVSGDADRILANPDVWTSYHYTIRARLTLLHKIPDPQEQIVLYCREMPRYKVRARQVAEPPTASGRIHKQEVTFMSRRKEKGAQQPVIADSTAAPEAEAATPTTTEASAEDAAPEAEPTPDPFAEVPTVNVGDDVTFSDFSDVATSAPRKYEAVNAQAIADRSPTAKGWKHERAMLVPGSNKKELKPGSVYGTIQQIVNAAGRAGIPAYVVANKLRRMQIGNKRSHYCEALPPVGWAEGWINTAMTKLIVTNHPTKQAPALRDEVTEGEAKANEAEAQGKLTANG